MTKYFNVGDCVYVAQAELFDNHLLCKKGTIKEIYKDTKKALVSFIGEEPMERQVDLCILEK